jgi:primosomal protein N' (replication factor Y)
MTKTKTTESQVLSIAVPSPLWQLFDYLPPPATDFSQLRVGVRIKVPFGRREVVGVLIKIGDRSTFPINQLKPAIEILDQQPLISTTLLAFCQWASDYYHHPLGEVMMGVLPKLLRQGKSIAPVVVKATTTNISANHIELNTAQQFAVDEITKQNEFQVFLLAGVTGSGKTEVYLRCIAHVLSQQKQALVLVPEIALTPQIVDRFRERFAEPMVLLHSNLTDKARAQAWLQAQTGEAKIIIGTRSAILTSLPNLGIIILDEEHDASFKQQSGFRYSARDLAVRYAQMLKIPVILGSATPSLESLYNVENNRYRLLTLPNRVGDAQSPTIKIIDIRKQPLVAGISEVLFAAMDRHLAAGQQVLLFLNRRGFAPTLMCHHCGWMMLCRRCDARMTLHQYPQRLYCHHCGSSCAVPNVCPDCKQSELIDLGLGTERLEQSLLQRYPQYKIVRIDRDSTRKKNSMQDKLQSIHDRDANILIGTQMLAKGHHFPHLTLVAIIDADSGLFGADFRALERMGQLFVQVAGRAGRAQKPGEVLLQTHHPDHPLLSLLLTQNYSQFADALLTERKTTALPPYAHMALLRAEAIQQKLPAEFLTAAKLYLAKNFNYQVQMLGPVPSTMERKAGRYRYQLLFQAIKRSDLHKVLQQLIAFLSNQTKNSRVRWSLDVDPQEMG